MAVAGDIAKARFRSFTAILGPLDAELCPKYSAKKLDAAAGAP
jgi:hypothetical protein